MCIRDREYRGKEGSPPLLGPHPAKSWIRQCHCVQSSKQSERQSVAFRTHRCSRAIRVSLANSRDRPSGRRVIAERNKMRRPVMMRLTAMNALSCEVTKSRRVTQSNNAVTALPPQRPGWVGALQTQHRSCTHVLRPFPIQ